MILYLKTIKSGKMKNKFVMVFFVLFVLIGAFCLGTMLFYLMHFFLSPHHPYRAEYIQGAAVIFLLSLPIWLVATFLSLKLKNILPKSVFFIVNSISAVLLIVFVILNIIPIIMIILDKSGF